MKQVLIFCWLTIATLNCYAQAPTLSANAEVSIITLGPWQGELYSAFGHSAIRVYDPDLNIDLAFNYGVFDFDQPNFYVNFARGVPYYMLGVYSYPHFRDAYISYNRFVHEQLLNLTTDQKQKVYDFLYWNAQPENRDYRYDYFYDNCATKIRDVFSEVLKGEVQFDDSYIGTDYSIRDLTDLYLKHQPWGDLGIDICLGLPMDKKAKPFEYMFIPDYIESAFDHATISNDSSTLKLVKETISVYESQQEEVPFGLFHPWVVFGLLFLIVAGITFWDWKRKKLSRWFDIVLFSLVGLIGLLLLLLWVATNHKAAAWNFNLLWAVPFHLIAVPFYFKKSAWIKNYFTAITWLCAVLILTWYWLPQQLNVFLIPIVAALLLRALVISRIISR